MHTRLTREEAVLLITVSFVVTAAWSGMLYDWSMFFRPAAEAVFHRVSPYSVSGFYSPPWVALGFVPLALLPNIIAHAILPLMAIAAWIAVARHLGATPFAMALLLVSPPVFISIYNGQLEWLVFMSLLLPARWGLLLVAVKPQVGLGIAVWFIAEAWREGRWRQVRKLLGPVSVALGASVALFGWWMFNAMELTNSTQNVSVWPFGVPVGLALLAQSVRRRDIRWALPAGPLVSIYSQLYSWNGLVLTGVHSRRTMVTIVSLFWVVVIIRAW